MVTGGRRFGRRAFLKGGLFLVGLGLTGCARQSAVEAPSSGQPRAGGTLVYAQNQPLKSLDPINPQTYPAAYEANYTIYDTLVRFDPQLNIVPGLAERWERSPDGLSWTFYLRRGVKFHDGTPFNARAVEAHIRRIQDPKNASPNKNLWDHIKDVKVVDDYTIRLSTERPFAAMLHYLAHGSGGIPSPEAVARFGANFPQNPVGTGPYKLEAFNPGTELVLVRNEEFWGGRPWLDRVVMRWVPEVSSRVAMVYAGQADLANDIPAEEADLMGRNPDTKVLRQQGLRTFWVEFNLNLDVFKDVRVRRALNYAVDKEAIVKNLFRGYARVLDSPAAPAIPGYRRVSEYPYDPDRARQLLTEAGFRPGPDGILRRDDGLVLRFSLNTAEGEYPKDIQVAEAVQANLRAVGCDVSIWKVEAAARWSYLRLPIAEAKYEAVLFGFNPSNGDLGYHLNSLFRSNPDRTKAPYVWNLMWYSNEQVDRLLDQADREVEPDRRWELLAQAQKLIWEDAPCIWLYVPDLLVGARRGVEGVYIWPTIFTVVREAWK